MKGILVAVLIVASASANTVVHECSDTSPVIPHPTNCNQFIRCDLNGMTGVCGEGLNFDSVKLICLPKDKAHCASVPEIPDTSPSHRVPECIIKECSKYKPFSLMPQRDCDKFYICNGRSTVEGKCPAGKHLSRSRNACVLWLDTDCQALDTLCIGKNSDFKMPARSCASYYQCNVFQQPELKTCKTNEHYNAESNACIPASASDCVDLTSINEQNSLCVGKANGSMVANDKDNTNKTYFICYGNSALPQDCEKGQSFNAQQQYCVAT